MIHLIYTGDPKKTQHLVSLEGAKERLHLFKADLLEQGSFDSAIDGCHGVFHTASPFFHDVKDPQVLFLFPQKLAFVLWIDLIITSYPNFRLSLLILRSRGHLTF